MKKLYFIISVLIFVGALFWMQDRYVLEQRSEYVLTDNSDGIDVSSDKLPAQAKTSGNGFAKVTSSAEGFMHSREISGNGVVSGFPAKRPRGKLADPEYRVAQVRKKSAQFKHEQSVAIAKAKREGWYPLNKANDPGQGQLMTIRNGKPLVYHVENANAAISTAANLVRDNSLYGVKGSNVVVGLWDAGLVRNTHVEFADGRVSLMDNAVIHYHSTHVCGTMIASGIYVYAKGMATAGRVESYDWGNDVGEMTGRAMASLAETNMLQLSNHSYGHISGWYLSSNPVRWYGTWGAGVRESDNFGNYSYEAADWDELCFNAPYYLPIKSAGNDRSDSAPLAGAMFEYYDGVWKSKAYDPATDPLADYSQGGFDTIPDVGNAKNILTIGAVNDAVIGTNRTLSQATMTPYSGWGPTDDGRIKPDIVGDGAGVTSTDSGSDDDYRTLQGTSMASPNVAGSAALLVEYYKKLFNEPISSSSLKGLIIHTASDLGPAGPDYINGWGLMNTQLAAEYIWLQHKYSSAGIMYENFLDTNDIIRNISIISDNINPIKATICWTDPAGTEQIGLDNRTPVLVNDLDLRIIDPNGITNFPFTLSVTNPAALAIPGDNILDNVEQIIIPVSIEGEYIVSVSHKADLTGSLQYYSLVISGSATMPTIEHEPLINSTNVSTLYFVEATINSLDPLKTDGTWLFWSTNSFASGVESNLMLNISNNLFGASIPAQPLGTEISYYIYTETSNSLSTTHPIDAPVTMHSFIVAPPVDLDVWGSPGGIGIVLPDYGTSIYPSGVVVHASASAVTPENAGHRYASGGWLGAGDVPAAGLSNAVSFLIERDSAMFWKWISQYSLIQTSSVPGIVSLTNWWKELSAATSVTAQVEVVHNSISYHFAEWLVDGVRQSDDNNIAVNPVVDLVMETSHVATVVYLPIDKDSDMDGLPDWWERYYFGSLLLTGEDDPDNDGYLNLEESEDKSNPTDPLSFPMGPTINHLPLPGIASNPAPWRVAAIVTDNNAVDGVILRWRRNGLNWRQTAMITNSVPDQYSATLPAPGLFDDSFEYIIQAVDMSGYYTEDGVHNIFVAYSVIDIVQTNIFDFVRFKNSFTNTSFSIGNNGNTNLDFQITLEPAGFLDDMESGTNDWQHSGVKDKWHITDTRYYSASNSWYCGDERDHDYDNGTHASLVTSKILLGNNSQLSFMHWLKSELDSGSYAWDGSVVEISIDKGVTYQMLTPEGGYSHLIVDNPDSPFAPDTPCMAGTGGWERVVFDLSAYSGKEAMIRFRFGADLYVVDEGWYIDDIEVTPRGITNDSSAWLTLNIMQDNIPALASSVEISLSVNTTNIPPRYSDTLTLVVQANDPIVPITYIPVSLQIESRPQVELFFAEQSPRDGQGIVTISNGVHDLDYDTCSLELLYSIDNGVSWTNLIINSSFAALGNVIISNNTLPQITGIVTTNIFGGYTNDLTTTWNTTNNIDAILLATNVMISCRAWDGKYWSDSVTSQPFIVDNELPSVPSVLTVTSHTVGSWATNRIFAFNWTASNDGDGIGLDGYKFAVTNSYGLKTITTNFTQLLTATDMAQDDGTNLWVVVIAIDKFGNSSASQFSGPFMVDSIPPSSQLVVVQIVENSFGDYVLGTEVDCSWSGFSDNLSGVSSYHIDIEDNTPTTNDLWVVQSSITISNSIPDQTNNIYVWAVDNAGLVSTSATASILVLSEQNDYDGDGLSNGDENIAGTDANNTESVFTISEEVLTVASNSYIIVSWNSITNRYYTLLNVSNLNDNVWSIVPAVSNIPGISGVMTYTNSLDISEREFYKVNVELDE